MQQELKFPGFPETPMENYWQYPRICNGWWHLLSGSEQKVLDYILRHTWGYKKTSDKISLSQFQNGITNKKTGEEVDKGIGIKRKDVILRAIKRLEEMGFIKTIQKTGKTKEFSLVTNGDTTSHQNGQVTSHQNGHTIEDSTIEDIQKGDKKLSPLQRDFNLLWDYFKEQYTEKISSEPPVMLYPKLFRLGKPILSQLGLESLKRKVDLYLDKDNSYYKNVGWSMDVFLMPTTLNGLK